MTGLEALERIENEYSIDEAVFYKEYFKQVRKELKALDIIKPYLRLSGNWLQTKVNIFNIDNIWEYVKEITDEEQLNLLKEVLE